jgi:hypothetical protein
MSFFRRDDRLLRQQHSGCHEGKRQMKLSVLKLSQLTGLHRETIAKRLANVSFPRFVAILIRYLKSARVFSIQIRRESLQNRRYQFSSSSRRSNLSSQWRRPLCFNVNFFA